MFSVGWLGVPALVGATLGCLVTASISYFGHQRFSFAVASDHSEYFPRFAALSVTSYLINLGIVALSVDVLQLSYKTAVVLVMLLIPVINYLLSRYWVFYSGILRLERER